MSDQEAWAPSAAPDEVLPLGDGLELRRWRARDDEIDALTTAVLASLDHLKPWMPWAHDFDRSAAAEYVARTERQWAARSDFQYGIRAGHEVLGSCGLHVRLGPAKLEIGYWLHVDHTGRGIARRTAAALTRAGFSLPDVDAVRIRHDPRNVRSGRVPEALGYRHLGVVAGPSADEGHDRAETSVWELTRAAHGEG